jgi:hypothetical protein
MKQRCSKTIIGILLANVIFVVCLGLYLNTYKDNIQQFHQGNYVEANNNNNYFNLDLDNQSIEYYNGEYFASEIQVLNDSIIVTEIEPFGKCLLTLENGTQNINLIFEKRNSYAFVTFSFRGNEFVKMEHR